MAQRKLQQEIDKEFKKVAEGVQLFESIYEKLTQSTNASQKEKLEDSLKKEIKKLQRSRDKIKGWASQNDIKDKKPLQDQRKLIETQMEKFKAVEKEMKTKAFSKEGLNAAAKLDPKEKEKMDVCNFLQEMIDELERQIEALEAEAESLQAGLKKGKKDSGKSERTAALESRVETHKWHIGKLELLLRSVENDGIEAEQVRDLETDIKYYVETNQEIDFMEDDTMYDDLNLEEEEGLYGMPTENDKVSSQDAQSTQDEPPDTEEIPQSKKPTSKSKSISETTTRRPSVQLKSTSQPLPPLATLQSIPSSSNSKAAETMKPAPLPTIPTGQPLKDSATTPPPGGLKSSATSSPAVTAAQPVASSPARPAEPQPSKVPEPVVKPTVPETKASEPEPSSSQASKVSSVKPSPQVSKAQPAPEPPMAKIPQPPSPDSGISGIALSRGEVEEDEEESIYHLPSSLRDLLDSFEETKQRAKSDQPFDANLLNASRLSCPTPMDAEKPNHYTPQNPYGYTPSHYPQEPLGIFDDPRLYSRIDQDSLFYAFYYRQGTYQQYLAAKALKGQSWRFHKQYQTWFQRHEEPKNITEEFEQGTYRFFDYESTWMNRRKADFKFAYKFLEDDI
ncbi:Putative CCR4-Not complex component, Not domain, CCR4-NOT complex subunit 2/3/5 domain superfamily [Septoria linicola]|uniref:General negative regulator of transcription subunit n=1 Tax=Septoria linicola TaxID=215465 RepID=A0A9Q9APL2_9PEZI|nr:Putative CCR4-Not complex component, Not domain, CCR4-NOT complex subunit 2/3/5 domain superfamily [Septoria linicola]